MSSIIFSSSNMSGSRAPTGGRARPDTGPLLHLSDEAAPWMGHPVFAAAGPEACRELARTYPMQCYAEGTRLLEEGDEADHLYICLSGAVHFLVRSPAGQEVLAHGERAPFLFGDLEMLQRIPCQSTAVVVEDVLIALIPFEEYQGFLQAHPAALMEHLRQISRTACTALERARMAFASIEERVAHLLLSEVGEGLETAGVGMSQRQISEQLGVALRSVARVFARWRRTGLVVRSGKRFVIGDPGALERRAGQYLQPSAAGGEDRPLV